MLGWRVKGGQEPPEEAGRPGDLEPARSGPGQRSASEQAVFANNSDLWHPRASTWDSQK